MQDMNVERKTDYEARLKDKGSAGKVGLRARLGRRRDEGHRSTGAADGARIIMIYGAHVLDFRRQ